jgi:hypothetical protein
MTGEASNMSIRTAVISLACTILFCSSAAIAQDKPNIVLVFLDNFGWGEPGFNGGGIVRGADISRRSMAPPGPRNTRRPAPKNSYRELWIRHPVSMAEICRLG